jgi:hypothetical protein
MKNLATYSLIICGLAFAFSLAGCGRPYQKIMHAKNPRDVNRDNPIVEQFTRKPTTYR